MYYIKRADVKIRHVDGELLVLDNQNDYIHQLNATASFIWQQCDGQSSITDIVQRMAEQFDLDMERATRDVSDVIQKLCELKLLSE